MKALPQHSKKLNEATPFYEPGTIVHLQKVESTDQRSGYGFKFEWIYSDL